MNRTTKIFSPNLLIAYLIISVSIFTLLTFMVISDGKDNNEKLMIAIQMFTEAQDVNFIPEPDKILQLANHIPDRYAGKDSDDLYPVLEYFNNFTAGEDWRDDFQAELLNLIQVHTAIRERKTFLIQILIYFQIFVIFILFILVLNTIKKRQQIIKEHQQQKSAPGGMQTKRTDERNRICSELQEYIRQDINNLLSSPEIINTNMSAAIKDIADDLNDLPNQIEPPELKSSGLKMSLIAMLNEKTDNHPVKIEYNFSGFNERLLSHECKLIFYRICQEAIGNIINHSEADHVCFTLNYSRPFIIMSIVDNGRGISNKTGRNRGAGNHLGLSLMKEKAMSIGANIDIKTAQNKGTGITLKYHVQNLNYA